MDLLGHNRQMARNNLWSNDRLCHAVLSLQPGEFEAKRTSFFPSIKGTLNHILSVDLFYLDMMEEGGLGLGIFQEDLPRRRPTSIAGLLRSATAFPMLISIGESSRIGARKEKSLSGSAICSRISSCTTSTIAVRSTRCCPALPSCRRNSTSFSSTMI